MSDSSYLTHYLPATLPGPVCQPGEFPFAAAALDHGHIYGQCHSLAAAGGTLRWVYDPDPKKVESFLAQFPGAKPAASLDQILDDPAIKLVTSAAIPCDRGPLGCRVLAAGKDYFTDKAPFTELSQLEEARRAVQATGRKFMVYYSERIAVECAVLAGELIAAGEIGQVVHVASTGPHRLNAKNRPTWFFEFAKYGGILCDIGSHQCEQFLHFTGATDADVNYSVVANTANPEYPELEDFGEICLTSNTGATGHLRVDWLTPDGLRTWGDGRTQIVGTKGYIELRKYIQVGADNPEGEQLYLANGSGEYHLACKDKVGHPFFGQLILDCLNRTEKAMTQDHAFKAAELCLRAQAAARRLR